MFNLSFVHTPCLYGNDCKSLVISSQVKPKEADFQVFIPKDLINQFFSYLNYTNLGVCSQVSKVWKEISDKRFFDKKVMLYKDVTFSPIDWNKNFGDDFIKKDDLDHAFNFLPPNIDEILCPINCNKKLIETHVVVWFPKGLTFTHFHKLFQKKFSKNISDSECTLKKIINQYGDLLIEKSEWVAMTKHHIPGSLNVDFKGQESLVKKINYKEGKCYTIPKLLEAIICISVMFFKSKTRIFTDCYMRCEEHIKGSQLIEVFGLKGPEIKIDNYLYDEAYLGVAGLRRLT